jgi:hypothetical protein
MVRRLPAVTSHASKLPLSHRYKTFKEQWSGWLEEYNGPGYYGRSDGKRDARWVYQHLNNGNMIVWLNEAAGERPTVVLATISEMLRSDVKQTQAAIARRHLPWERVAELLFNTDRGASEDQSDLVDIYFRPFVRALGNLVIAFALCESELLGLVTAMAGGNELQAIAILKGPAAKDSVIKLAHGLSLPPPEAAELVSGIESFWEDRSIRNRMIHDEWFPDLFELGGVRTRGVTRAKQPEVVFGDRSVDEVWALAERFQQYDGLFSHRSWELAKSRRS